MRFRDFHRTIKIRIFESFLSRFIGGMIFPFMAIYLAKYFGVTVTGMLLLINVLVGIGITFIGGYYADQFGRKKIILFAETLRFLAFFAMMLFNSPWLHSPTVTFLMMTVNSICWGLAGPATQAMLIDVSTPEQRKLMYSITYWANNLSIAIGGALGGFLFEKYLFQLFIGLSGVSLLTVILIRFFIDESYSPNTTVLSTVQHIKQLVGNYQKVIQDRLFVLFTLAGVFILSMEFQLTNYIGIRLSNQMTLQHFLFWDIDGIKMLGFLRTENTILVVLLILFSSRLVDRFKDRNVLVLSSLVFTIGYGVIAYSNHVWVLILMMLFLTIGEVFRIPVQQTYLASLPPDDARSSYMALNGLTFNLAMLISSVTVSISAFFSTAVMASLITGIGVIGVIIYLFTLPGLEERVQQNVTSNFQG